MYQLEIPLNRLKELSQKVDDSLAEFTEQVDQVEYKRRVGVLLTELESVRTTAGVASNADAGVTKIDVLEWAESKPLTIKRYKNELRIRLARLIGWECPVCSVENCF